MSDLIIIRGLPGSGKSTIAKALVGYHHVESDMFFLDDYGHYEFKPELIGWAHNWCQTLVREYLELDMPVVVSNTFTQWWEMEPYIKMCKELNKNFSIIIARGKFQNIHNVPEDVMEKMRLRWED